MNNSIPSNWSWVKLGEILKVKSGNGLTSSEMLSSGKFPVYGGNGITGYYNDYIFEESQLIIGRVGAKCGILHITKPKCWVTDNALVVYIINENALIKYLYYCLTYNDLNKLSVSTAQPVISGSKIYPLKIPLPPLPVQKKIVAKIEELFSELDNGIEQLKKAKEQLKIYRQAVLKFAFDGKLTNHERLNGIQEVNSILKAAEPEVSYNPKDLSEGWKWVNLGDYIESMKNGIYKPKEFYNDDGVACLRMYNIQNGKIEWFDIKRMKLSKEEIKEYELIEGDLLVNRVNSRELVGKSALIIAGIEKCVYESKNIRVRLKREIDNKFVNYWFLYNASNYFNHHTQQTVGMASINQVQISNMPIPFTELSLQHQIVEEIESRFSVAEKLERTIDENLKKSETLRQSILKQAFEGRLL